MADVNYHEDEKNAKKYFKFYNLMDANNCEQLMEEAVHDELEKYLEKIESLKKEIKKKEKDAARK